jgi:hypothetical protein
VLVLAAAADDPDLRRAADPETARR